MAVNFRNPKDIEDKIKQAETVKDGEIGMSSPNYNFADGVIAALDWVTGNGDDPFMDF